MFNVASESSASSPVRPEPHRPSAPDARSEPSGFAALIDANAQADDRPRAAKADRRDPPPASRPPQDPPHETAADADPAPSDRSAKAEKTTSGKSAPDEAEKPAKHSTKPAKASEADATTELAAPLSIAAAAIATSAQASAMPAATGDNASPITEAVMGAVSEVNVTNFTIAKTIATTPVPTAEPSLKVDAPQASASPLASIVATAAAKTAKPGDGPSVTPADPAQPEKAPSPPSSSAAPPDAAPANPHPPGQTTADATPAASAADTDRAKSDATVPSAGGQHAGATASQPQSQPQPATPDATSPFSAILTTPQTPATAPIPAAHLTATAATNLAVPVSGLAVEIAASARAGNSRFEIRLDPAELGRIDVRLSVDRHGNVSSHLTVEKPETLAMLRQDAQQLQRALEDAGLKSGQSSLQFSLRDQSSGHQNNGGGERQPQRLVISDASATPLAAANTTYTHAAGASRGLDIRV